MKLKYDIKACTGMRRRVLMALLACTCFSLFNVQAQIKIKGNVYGGGNQGDVAGSTAVTVRGGDFNRVYGGARMADVGGNAFVHLDGASASSYTIINYVFGGNDISGTIKGEAETCSVPSLLTHAGDNHIDETWNTFVLVSSKLDEDGKVTSDNPAIFVGQLFGGGNGNYTYSETPNSAGKYEVRDGTTLLGTSDTQFDRPVLAKTYLEILGGSIANVFGGGNMATVTQKTVICVDNPSEVVDGIIDENGNNLLTTDRVYKDMGLNKVTVDAHGTDFQISNLFGGNNKAVMRIQPEWNLRSGSVRNLYSGGNEGDMTSRVGLLLEIPEDSKILVDNVYGGCRKADVRPQDIYGKDITEPNDIVLENYKFPAGLSARVLVRGGDINNVYGGNDISGDVWGGTAVGIYCSIRGDVYGGGNGSYAYTDNAQLKNQLTWGDFYYDVNEILKHEGDFTPMESAEALSIFRPNAERVSLRLYGKDADHPTIIGGSVYVGGNSATLRNDRTGADATGELKIGSNVIADHVFLANNGINMVDASQGGILARYYGDIEEEGVLYDFSQMNLKDRDIFAKYMDGCAMSIHPSIVFDDKEKGDPETYEEYSTSFGSLFFGGNVGSMTWEGTTTLNVNHKIIIYDKVVGGCNRANVAASDYNAEYLGGIIGSDAEQAEHGMEDENGNIRDCLVINLSGIRVQPKRWIDVNDKSLGVEWNTYDVISGAPVVVMPGITGETETDDLNRRLHGGNIYGGCYESGHINGNVVINLADNIVEKEKIFDEVEKENEALYGNDKYIIKKRNSGVILDRQGMDPLGLSLNVFGGGYGKDAEVWGATTVNLTGGYTFQIFGGGELGAIGKHEPVGGKYIFDEAYNYPYDARYSTHVNLHGPVGATETNDVPETEFIYGGSFMAPIAGNTIVHLGNGRVFNSFAGSCNADIIGHTETYVGLGLNANKEEVPGFPYVRDHIYGGNDLGGRILGEEDFSGRVRAEILPNVYNRTSTTHASAYIEYQQGHLLNIFGGAYGDYDYSSSEYSKYVSAAGFTTPRMGNAFINFKPVNSSNALNGVEEVYGAGQGRSQVRDRDVMQERSYILIDIPQTMTSFQNMAVFGAGSFSGLGMEPAKESVAANPDMASAVIDLFRGQLVNVYGASYKEGITRRTVVNVPTGSTVKLTNIFGGAFGIDNVNPCDAYETNVNFNTGNSAIVYGGIYGGNNAYRRTIYSHVNINAPVYSNDTRTYQGYVYGAGLGKNTWAQYTDVNINDGGIVYKVYGGGNEGSVLNNKTVTKKKTEEGIDLTIDSKYEADGLADGSLVPRSTLDGTTHNTSVRIHQGGEVTGYAYGAGRGSNSVVSGSTNGEVLGGIVSRDFYAGGEGGAVCDHYALRNFTATANLYVESGSVRNCYGGGYLGDVGYHDLIEHDLDKDVLAESHVVVGKRNGGTGFYDGIPAVMRNAYAGGEGGSIFGDTYLTINNGYVGYRYNSEGADDPETLDFDERYEEEVIDGSQSIEGAGNCFGGGYILNSYVDNTVVTLYDGFIRGSLYGGGELGPVGRGQNSVDYGPEQEILPYPIIHKPGSATVTMYGGHVMRDVFGGGRGEDSWGGDGTMFMSAAQKALSDFNAKGFVYGITRVNVHGGEIGTAEGVAHGHGNVFGGGDIGFVYSGEGEKVGSNPNVLSETNGLPEDGGGYYYKDGDVSQGMTLDCSVDVSPSCPVISPSGITIDGQTFAVGEYVPVEYLNKLRNKSADAAQWAKLNLDGIIIHNAVFAGGNVSAGSDKMFVNTKTVFGNAAAALRDVYHRDLITIGSENTGGLYGDGNLTFVDGYRELHIGNYGTDFYGLEDKISIEEYQKKSDRERAYFKLQYECVTDVNINGVSYSQRKTIDEETYESFPEAYKNETYWKLAGFCTIYAGRLLNTIQRADMVGVFGSRMVLQGATDRVPEKADYTQYTINRVGELSLNRVAAEDGSADEHGNYFGIYSVVNYLGALTSDVSFNEVRTTNVAKGSENEADGTTSYYKWKYDRPQKKNRNNGTSQNKLSLASGVYLEIIREESEKAGETKWGDITGVVELDLIDVMTGLGGGYVYARNEHGVSSHHQDWGKVILSPYNTNAHTYKKYTYNPIDDDKLEMETSGNFVHYTKQIVDDCFPVSNSYKGEDAMKAHYWYIKGSVYVYDQYISAYTGSSSAYSESVSIPLPISAVSHGKLTLCEVKPNLYAYYDKDKKPLGRGDAETSFEANGKTYSMNDPITWWEWVQLNEADQQHFVNDTYTAIMDCEHDGITYPKGYTLLRTEYEAMKEELMQSGELGNFYCPERERNEAFDFLFRPSNNLSHNTGYALTFDIDNPLEWNNWYTESNDPEKSIDTETYNDAGTNKNDYVEGPTYQLTDDKQGVYGQKAYVVGDIIPNSVYDTYMAIAPIHRPGNQAEFKEAYVVTSELSVIDNNNVEHHLFPGVPVVEDDYPAAQWASISGKVAIANVITSTMQLSEQDYLYAGDLITDAQKEEVIEKYDGVSREMLNGYVAKAYYCTVPGNYGGKLYEPHKTYTAIDAWCSMSEEDRKHFSFNYDALDVLIDPEYGGSYGRKSQYDGVGASDPYVTPNNPLIYSVQQAVDYNAIYTGEDPLEYTDGNGNPVKILKGDELSRHQYESIPNERYHYTSFTVTEPGEYYVVKTGFIRGDMPYSVGEAIDKSVFESLNEAQQDCVQKLLFTEEQLKDNTKTYVENDVEIIAYTPTVYYYCRSSYDVGENGEGRDVKDFFSGETYTDEQTVPQGTVITLENYTSLVNMTVVGEEHPFTIVSNIPYETSTLYVSRESDIYDLSKDKVISVVYQYDYEESDETGMHITPVSERHIVNIHIEFKSGVPQIGQLSAPPTIIPGTTVGLKVPSVTPGAYEVLSSGWELFADGQDAASHKNGMSYLNNNTPMYWYQDGYYIAYYAKTYLGKTYSNAVQFSVANYHDLDRVMQDKEHHMYVDHENVRRDPKIYIDSRECESDPSKNELDLLKDFFELTLHEAQYDAESDTYTPISGGALDGHVGVNTLQIGNASNLEFILRSDMSPMAYTPEAGTTWTPIGSDGQCFAGTLHGDGYTISGLDHSLFHELCGNVYNLGVTGSFSGAGLVDTGSGYVENCWVISSAAEVDKNVHAVFGTPSAPEGRQVVNCYYPATNAYSEDASERGNARKMPLASFYNGEVAYDLNGFYLKKRYYDRKQSSGKSYGFFRAGDGGTLSETPEFAYYPTDYVLYPLSDASPKYGYVENRYADGDFIYAGGSVPEDKNERLHEDATGQHYYPIWPDDYLFFGQKLNYGYVTGRVHQDHPSHINKSGTRLTAASADINRVFRAPAYFRSGTMGMAHYNPYAIFAQKSKDGLHDAYIGMTAIDFTGGNGDLSRGYQDGLQENGHFFPPLLDHEGLEALRNADLTRNWLVYTPAATTNEQDAVSRTHDVVTTYLHDVAYSEVNTTYRNVGRRDETSIYGHAVVQNGSNFKAPNDHFLVDKQDFNAPIPYTFADDKRMYYQRRPDTYVDMNKGWESVSLPFEAELVTTNGKGEISHFYGDSRRGHEYWLREYRDISGVDAEQKATAVFTYPAAVNGNEKEYRNTYLWDHYYSANDRDDVHHDDYQEGDINGIYYSTPHTYTGYAYLQPATPYIIGFPGSRYYEFDLSGSFDPEHTAEPVPSHVAVQTITFASNPGISIAVSDTELEQGKVTHNGYTFWPNYLEGAVPTDGFLMASDGGSYLKTTDEQTEAEKTVLPFRTYFTVPASSGIKRARQIIFSGENSSLYGEEGDMNGHDDATGRLIVRTKPGYILVTSTLTEETSVHVVTATGITLGNFRIAPGETKETQTGMPGVYIVTADSIHFNKKVIVK